MTPMNQETKVNRTRRWMGFAWLFVCGIAAAYFFAKGATVATVEPRPAPHASCVKASAASPQPGAWRLKPIEQVEAGERVWAYDPKTQAWSSREVIRPLEHDYDGDVIRIIVGGQPIEATGNHPFWVASGSNLSERPAAHDVPAAERAATESRAGRWVEARSLLPGDLLVIRSGQMATVEEVAARRAKLKVYNLQVADLHTYAVGEAGIAVHNKAMQIARIRPAGSRILNLGGEGEVPGAVNMNNLSGLRRSLATIRASGPLVQADMLDPFPFTDASFDEVVANRLPAFDATQRPRIALEAFRVVRSGGQASIMNSVPGWKQALEGAGFQNVRVSGGYVVGMKP